MKILLCSEFYKPHIGGVEIHTEVLANYFSENNQITIATTKIKDRNNYSYNDSKIKIKEFDIKGSLAKGYSGDVKRYENFLLNSKFDVIFFNAAQQWTFDLSLNILKEINSKKIFFPCGFSRINNILFKPYFQILSNKLNYFDEIICCSKSWNDYKFCSKYFIGEIKIISNGANKIKANKIQLKKNTKKYISISNLKFLKGQDRVIKIFNGLDHASTLNIYYSSYNFVYRLFIQLIILYFNKINHFKNKKIYLINIKKRIIVSQVFKNTRAFIFGSRIEYCPLVMFESMSMGVPFVSHNVGIIHEIINKKYLGIVSNENIKLINYINNLSKNNSDVSQKIISQFNNKYDWSILLKKYKPLFKKNK
jgi:glycosyltransferase involved in cell wall biosynthesis